MNVEREIERQFEQLKLLVGPRHGECSFENFEVATPKQESALDSVREYVRFLPKKVKEGENLILFGPPGTGKDHLICAAARYAIKCGLRVFEPLRSYARCDYRGKRRLNFTWLSGAMLAQVFRDAMKDDASTETLMSVDILAISDPALNSEMSDFQARELFRLIDHRYRHWLPVWITCNMEDPQDFDYRLTQQVADRLRDNATAIFFDWESHRKVKNPTSEAAADAVTGEEF